VTGRDAAARVRLDKWLWAARFFKTRGLASEAVDAGRVRLNGDRVKPAKPVHAGDRLEIRLGPYLHAVEVTALSERRGPAAAAARLFQETPESAAERERIALQLKVTHALFAPDNNARPSKRDRRRLERFRRKSGEE